MALVEPYPLVFLSSILRVSDCQFSVVQFEEESGSGSGQMWAAELADPLWQVAVSLAPCEWRVAREVNAKVNALGTMKSMHFADPTYTPSGGVAGPSVAVGGINSARTEIALTGLPGAYRIAAGDRLSIDRNGASYYFGEFVEPVIASGAGQTGQVAISPALPVSIGLGDVVAMDAPVIRLRVPQGGFSPYREMMGGYSSGASINLVQKR